MQNRITECESALANKLGRRHCILTGRGSAALWLAYSLTESQRPKILIPATICLSPIFAAYYAGKQPVFADVLEQDSTIDPHIVEKMLQKDPSIGAVLAVHLFGHPSDLSALKKICEKYDVLLIEDLAQALGGEDCNGNLFGSQGPVSICSFGHTKILDVGGGGALLLDDDLLAERTRKLIKQMPVANPDYELLSIIYRKLYYTIFECCKLNPDFYNMFNLFPGLFHDLYFPPVSSNISERILNALSGLDKEVSHRRLLTKIYKNELASCKEIYFFKPSGPGIPWRYTFRLKSSYRDKISESIRKKGWDISSWYPCAIKFTPEGRKQGAIKFPVASRIEKEVVNLWVDKTYTVEKTRSLSKVILDEIARA